MELVYAALLLHSIGKPVDEASVKKIVTAAGGKTEEAQIKALVANLKDVNIEDAIKVSGLEGQMEALDLTELIFRHLLSR